MLDRVIETDCDTIEEPCRRGGPAARERLARARVLVVGLEPWGVVAAADLAAAGIGALHVLDDGVVTDDDLLAVRLFTGADRGRTRSAALEGALSQTAPACEVSAGPLLAEASRPLQVGDAGWDLIIVCVHADDLLVSEAAARFAHVERVPSIGAHLDDREAVIGPAVVPGETACSRCARLRRLANSARLEADHALQTSLLAERPRRRASTHLSPTAGLLGHALALAALEMLAAPRDCRLAGRLLVRDVVTLRTSLHAVLRLPWCDLCGGARAGNGGVRQASERRLTAGTTSRHPPGAVRDVPTGGDAERDLGLGLPAHGGAAPEGSGVGLDTASDPVHLRRMLEGIVDERTGIVQRLLLESPTPAAAPEAPRTATAMLGTFADGRRRPHRCDCQPELGAGKGITALEAMVSAVGEAVERYSASRFDPREWQRASVAERKAAASAAPPDDRTAPPDDRAAPPDDRAAPPRDFLPPERLCLYGESQYSEPGFRFARLGEETPIDWVLGRWLDTGSPVWVPALPTFFEVHVRPKEDFCQVTSNGLAAGATLEDAEARAALELIERDAFMISWLARLPGRRIDLDGSVDPDTREVARQLGAHGARLELYLLDVGLGVPTVVSVGFGDGRRWPGATVAMAAHQSPRAAVRKAVLEQAHVGPYLRRHMIEGTLRIPERPEDVRSLIDHAAYYFPPSRAGAFTFLGAGEPARASDLAEPDDLSPAALVACVRAADLRIAVVDVTSPDLAGTPFRVARALGPDFQQIHFGHRFARLGNPRLLAMAQDGINPDPHPMA